MAAWYSLYLPSDNTSTIETTLAAALARHAYTPYDPFDTFTPGAIYARSVKLFLAPPREGWTRILVSPDAPLDAELLPPLSQVAPVLSVVLTKADATLTAYHAGDASTPGDAFAAYLRTGSTPDDLRRALTLTTESTTKQADHDKLPPLDVLPDDVQQMAASLNPRQVNRLFGRMMRQVNRMVGADKAAEARALLHAAPDWDSAGGRRIRAVIACLTLPEGWHTPDFVSLRDAYRLHLRRATRPDAPSLPGDEDAMAQVPDALDYIPVYAGKTQGE